jgi:hypothetical protein
LLYHLLLLRELLLLCRVMLLIYTEALVLRKLGW